MRYLYFALLIILVSAASCKKKNIAYTCPLYPTLTLAPDGYTQEQWDTLVLKLYTANTNELVSTDTFYPKNLLDVVVVYVDEDYNYDLTIDVPATGKTHWVRAISLTDAVLHIKENANRPDCYKNLSYTVDGTPVSHVSRAIITERLKYP